MNYKFSVVIPIYNLEKYLDESISSVLTQTIGFQDCIQLILVNDGSTDRTEEICENYRNNYPENIIYIRQENKGVSAARNAGLMVATGKYINFFDGDDIWSQDAFQKAWDFMQRNETEIDVATCVQKLFEAVEGYRETYYKFRKGDRIINVKKEPAAVELSVSSAFFKRSAIQNLRFDERLDYGENAKFMAQAVLQKGTYGVLQSAEYMVRRRADGTSSTQNYKMTWQTTTLKYCHKYLHELSIGEYAEFKPYLQNVILKTLKYRVIGQVLDLQQKEEYLTEIRELINEVDDEVIIAAPYMGYPLKLYLLKIKHKEEWADLLRLRQEKLFWGKKRLVNLAKRTMMIETIEVSSGQCCIQGQIRYALEESFSIHAIDHGKKIPVEIIESEEHSVYSVFGELVCEGREFTMTFPLSKEVSRIRFIMIIGKRRIELEPVYKEEVKEITNGFLRRDQYMVMLNEEGKLIIKPYSVARHIKFWWEHRQKTIKNTNK